MESLISREATFLFNNLLFVGLAFAVLWGVMYPVISKNFLGDEVTVTTPFFEFFAVAFGLPLLALMGIGPAIAWRRASLRSLRATFGIPFAVATACGLLLVLLGYGTSPAGVVAYSLCVFVTIAIGIEFARGASARRALSGVSWPRALGELIARNRRRYGGYIAHLSIVLLVIGIVGTMAYGTQHEQTLRPGDVLAIRDYRLTFTTVRQESGANFNERAAVFTVTRGGETLGTIAPANRFYPIAGSPDPQRSNEAAIRTDWARGEDLFLILDSVRKDGSVTVKVLINPLVNVLWLGALVFVLGATIAAWPDRREARRIARRYAEEPLAGEA
jgi:cytochrome c-type biogenesis protein CcmF